MKTTQTIKIVVALVLASLLSVSFLNCNKNSDYAQMDIKEKMDAVSNDDIMDPGPDPNFVDYGPENTLLRTVPLATTDSWERYMYVDKTDTFYTNTQGKNTFSKYLKKYGFKGVYLYSTSTILSSNSNYSNFASFLKQLNDSGVIYRAAAKGSSSSFSITGDVSKYNASQSDPTKKINRANLELEWWNNVCTWAYWNTTNQGVSLGTISDNDFYEGWYKNLGTTIDTIAARDQVIYSDRILLHCYQNGIPTYSYANAQSTGSTGGRLDIIAKGARQANKRIDVFIIISAESTAWGASNTFTGPALASAYVGGAANPFQYIEQQAYNNIYNNMTAFQKQWINLKGFVWFTKRYCYKAVIPA